LTGGEEDLDLGGVMRRSAVVVLAVVAAAATVMAGVFASLYFGNPKTERLVVTKVESSKPSPFLPQPLASPRERVVFGYIKSLSPRGNQYELRFDPALLVSGVTAKVAQAEDEGTPCRPIACPPVANDNYVVDAGQRLLTYLVPANAHVTVIAGTVSLKRITVAELARRIENKSAVSRDLLAHGFWIRVNVDTVSSFYEQYHP
jgi:hypothetical protein